VALSRSDPTNGLAVKELDSPRFLFLFVIFGSAARLGVKAIGSHCAADSGVLHLGQAAQRNHSQALLPIANFVQVVAAVNIRRLIGSICVERSASRPYVFMEEYGVQRK
jgi:hypothetical protein